MSLRKTETADIAGALQGLAASQPRGPMRPDVPRALTVAQFCAAYAISRSSTYKLIKQKKLRTIKLAGRRLIPLDEAERLLSEATQ